MCVCVCVCVCVNTNMCAEQALHQLRKRKRLQQQLEKKSSCVNTLHEIIHRIEESSSNEMVCAASVFTSLTFA